MAFTEAVGDIKELYYKYNVDLVNDKVRKSGISVNNLVWQLR